MNYLANQPEIIPEDCQYGKERPGASFMDVTRSVPFITAQGHIQHLLTSKTTYDTDDTDDWY